ncbi:MAG: hypothetical protein AAF891_02115 [Pseudomonadota bacterium]
MKRRTFLLGAGAPLVLAACGGAREWASDEMVARMAFRDPGPSYLTLMTMINNRTGQGGHTSLMANASQRVIWDPAGTFKHSAIPERNDVIYGVNPQVFQVYRGAHARETHHVVLQKKIVSPEVAERAFALMRENGPAASATCAMTTSAILQQLDGFERISSHWYPHKLMANFAEVPGVITDKYYENDAGDKKAAFGAAAQVQITTN